MRTLNGLEFQASILVRSWTIDLAILAVDGLIYTAVKFGKLDRDRITVVRNVMAVGFPNYKFSEDRPTASKRQPAQPVGSVPTVEDFSSGELTLKIEAGEPAFASKGRSPWDGLSGAGVIVGEQLLGIVVEHHLIEGNSALRVVPPRLADMPVAEKTLFCAILGIDDVNDFPTATEVLEDDDEALRAVERELKQLMALGDRGVLTPAELSTLKIIAVKEAKGWH